MSGQFVTAAVRGWIREATGIHVTGDNQAPVDLAIRLDAERRRLSPAELIAGVLSGRLPAQPLIDAITTNESYFFRAAKQMGLTVDALLPQRLHESPGRAQRILSLPCARGEEPFSIAILLRERGIPDAAVTLVGGDISERCLADARRGEYNALALRRTDSARAQRWFRPLAGRRYRLDPAILARVQLHSANLLTSGVAALGGPFDIVFCQNLLIYFDRDTIERALAMLHQLMRPDGWLFVDHSEWNLPRGRFRMQERDGCVGFRPVAPVIGEPATRLRTPPTPLRGPVAGPQGTARAAAGADRPAMRTSPAPPLARENDPVAALDRFDAVLARAPHDPPALLGKARVLADGGDELEALECLERLLAAIDDGEALASASDRVDALALFAVLLVRKGLDGLAQGYLEELARLAPQHPVLRLRGGRP